MTYQNIIRKHPNKFIVAIVDIRHPDTGVAVLYKVLQTSTTKQGLLKMYDYYKTEGFKHVVTISTYAEDDIDAPDMPPELTAGFFREYFNM